MARAKSGPGGTGSQSDGLETVKVAATPILRVAGAVAYHTSVVVGTHEYYFDAEGIICVPALWSHNHLIASCPGNTTELVQVGQTVFDGQALRRGLSQYFQVGSYDVLLKNCNSFADVAVYFLTRSRLEGRFSRIDRFIANTRPLSTRLLAALVCLATGRTGAGGTAPHEYEPNPHAVGFTVEGAIAAIDAQNFARRQPHTGANLPPLCNPLAGCYGGAVEVVFDEVPEARSNTHDTWDGLQTPPHPPPPPRGKQTGSLLGHTRLPESPARLPPRPLRAPSARQLQSPASLQPSRISQSAGVSGSTRSSLDGSGCGTV